MKSFVNMQNHKSGGKTDFSGATSALCKIGASSSANTVFTNTGVTDASAWTLTAVLAGDVAVSSDGMKGVITGTGSNSLTIAGEWRAENGDKRTPANGSTVTIYRLDMVRRLRLKADASNAGTVYIGTYGSAVNTDFPLTAGQSLELLPEDGEWLDAKKVFGLVSGGTQTIWWIQGGDA